MSNYIWKILSLVAITTLIATFCLFLYQKRYYKNIQSENILQNSLLDTLNFYRSNYELNLEMTGLHLSNFICYNSNEKYKVEKFMIQGKPLLIYRYTDIECSTCVENILDDINTTFNNSPEKVLILCSYKNKNEFRNFTRKQKTNIPILLTDFNNFSWIPFVSSCFFVLYPNFTVSNFYLPSMEFTDINKAYINSIWKIIEAY